MYQRSARIYDLLYAGAGIKDFRADADRLRELIHQANPTARTLLDVACGTGLHLAHLREHFEVEGVDQSPEMVAVARGRLPGVLVTVGDMQRLELNRRFDAVTCLFSSIGYITDTAGLVETVGRLAEHLEPAGVLVLDGWIRPDSWHDDHRALPDIADDGVVTVARLTTTSRQGSVTVMEMHHLVRSGAEVEYFVEHHVLALVRTQEYVTAVEAAGLRVTVVQDYIPGRDRVVATRPG